MDADLVGASRLEPNREERRAGATLDHAEMRDRGYSRLAAARGPAPPVAAVPHELEADRSGVLGHLPFDDRDVFPLDLVPPKQLLKFPKRLPSPREDEHSGSVLVEAVDDPDERPLPVPILEVGVDTGEESVPLLRFGRNGQQPRGLLDEQHVAVFEENAKVRTNPAERRTVHVEADGLVFGDVGSRLAARGSLEIDAAGLHVFARLPPGKGESAGDELIEAHLGTIVSGKSRNTLLIDALLRE